MLLSLISKIGSSVLEEDFFRHASCPYREGPRQGLLLKGRGVRNERVGRGPVWCGAEWSAGGIGLGWAGKVGLGRYGSGQPIVAQSFWLPRRFKRWQMYFKYARIPREIHRREQNLDRRRSRLNPSRDWDLASNARWPSCATENRSDSPDFNGNGYVTMPPAVRAFPHRLARAPDALLA